MIGLRSSCSQDYWEVIGLRNSCSNLEVIGLSSSCSQDYWELIGLSPGLLGRDRASQQLQPGLLEGDRAPQQLHQELQPGSEVAYFKMIGSHSHYYHDYQVVIGPSSFLQDYLKDRASQQLPPGLPEGARAQQSPPDYWKVIGPHSQSGLLGGDRASRLQSDYWEVIGLRSCSQDYWEVIGSTLVIEPPRRLFLSFGPGGGTVPTLASGLAGSDVCGVSRGAEVPRSPSEPVRNRTFGDYGMPKAGGRRGPSPGRARMKSPPRPTKDGRHRRLYQRHRRQCLHLRHHQQWRHWML